MFLSHIHFSYDKALFFAICVKNGLTISHIELGAERYCLEFKKGHKKQQQMLSIAKLHDLCLISKCEVKILARLKYVIADINTAQRKGLYLC